ncbi:hypothetical protein FisN_5Lh067 [Fistulifera solaris]|uniref:AAA+ ATPase domain-containing protein n=1 Tax=Fistulifera solaris TaxID=1519565 RepID=A0A1Z5JJ37_FISSO|nr:hypothetical protein FisN_5Lh067 [Fistulifera solaris]|eukprot:GAX14015.1 hypothetical protein FisN_5Lh067 [Fistulifera solaris]
MGRVRVLYLASVIYGLSAGALSFQHVDVLRKGPESFASTSNRQLSLHASASPSRGILSNSFPRTSPLSKSPLYSSFDETSGQNSPRQPRSPILKILRKLVSLQVRLSTRFSQLSKRARRILMVQGLVIALLFGSIANTAARTVMAPSPVEISYSRFLDLVERQQEVPNDFHMDQVRIGSERVVFRLYPQQTTTTADSSEMPTPIEQAKHKSWLANSKRRKMKVRKTRPYISAYARKVAASPELLSALRKNDISFAAESKATQSVLSMFVRSSLLSFYFLILWRLYQTVGRAGGGGGKNDVPGKLAKVSDLPLANFDEIQGIDDVKAEVMELVDTLRNPNKYAMLGARAPTGLLLEGPPGTGKTMLARATAATAGVPLIYCSGSDFVEMFVGRGAARVRNLFEKASKLSPCILFIDELDALGKTRDFGAGSFPGMSRSNDEAEQTLNQLLACMDGLDSTRGICVLAATNRRDVLDPALVRPGRFDRIVQLRLPDAKGRENILRVHCKRLPGFLEGSGVDSSRPGALGIGQRVDLSAIAALTDGFSGAELEFLVNEAAIRAVRRISDSLRDGSSHGDITPHVRASDFEESLANFFATRRQRSGPSLFKNVWKQ